VTICTYDRVHLFGDIVNGKMQFSKLGQIAHNTWPTIVEHRPNVELDAFVVMPNHIHGIVLIFDQPQPNVGLRRTSAVTSPSQNNSKGSHSGSLGSIMGAYKAAVTRAINLEMGLLAPIVWQASFHDHIIRNEASLNTVREYVYNNPANWEKDTFYI